MNRKQRKTLESESKKMARTKEELQQAYAQLCTTAGDLQYQISSLELRLKEVNQRIMILNKEYHESLSNAAPNETSTPNQAPQVEELKDASEEKAS